MIHKLDWFSSATWGVAFLVMGVLSDMADAQQPYPAGNQAYQQAPPNQNQNSAAGQDPYGASQYAPAQPVVRPMEPVARPATAPQAIIPPQFQLTPEQQDYVDRVLIAWERYGDQVKTFEAKFTLRTYGSVFDNGQEPKPQLGILKYEKPDKGYFEITGSQPEKWICDGMSLFQYEFTKKELTQHVLPPEERGQSIQNGPLPFLFGAKAAMLKQRYWIRALPSPETAKDQIWLQAFSKYPRDAADFSHAEMIVSAKNMHPIGIQLHLPNGKTIKSYAFQDVVINDKNPLNFFKGDPFKPQLPLGWTKVVQNPESAQADTNPTQLR